MTRCHGTSLPNYDAFSPHILLLLWIGLVRRTDIRAVFSRLLRAFEEWITFG